MAEHLFKISLFEDQVSRTFDAFNFCCSDKRYKENHSAENRNKTPVHSKVMSIYLLQRPFTVHELDFNYNALSCDVTDDFNFYVNISSLKY